jgi:hypothetical protein
MRQILLLLLCVGLCTRGVAQKHYRMAGYIQMPGNPLVSYYVELTSDGNSVSGYSITGYQDGNRLKASVTGRFTTASDLYITETGSLDDAASARFQTYCYFSAHLKLTIMMNGKQRWNGSFESRQMNGAPCGGGTMTITDDAPPLDEVPKPKPSARTVTPPKVDAPTKAKVTIDTPKVTPAPVVKRIDTPKPPPVVVAPKPKPVTVVVQPPTPPPPSTPPPDSCQRTYEWNSNELAFDIWDGWTIDGDVVSLTINGKSLLNHAKLSETKQRFSIPLVRGLNVLYISLHEEGFDPPNTPNLTLFDGSKTYELSVSGEVGEVARICIWKR